MTMPLADLATSGFIFFVDFRESPVEWGAFEGTFTCEVETTKSRTHFEEYSEVFQKSLLYPSSSRNP